MTPKRRVPIVTKGFFRVAPGNVAEAAGGDRCEEILVPRLVRWLAPFWDRIAAVVAHEIAHADWWDRDHHTRQDHRPAFWDAKPGLACGFLERNGFWAEDPFLHLSRDAKAVRAALTLGYVEVVH